MGGVALFLGAAGGGVYAYRRFGMSENTGGTVINRNNPEWNRDDSDFNDPAHDLSSYT